LGAAVARTGGGVVDRVSNPPRAPLDAASGVLEPRVALLDWVCVR
jgi:hypothetical protein